jgi:hypothetical protein
LRLDSKDCILLILTTLGVGGVIDKRGNF